MAYKTAPIKKIGNTYWRVWARVGTKKLADWEKQKVKRGGSRVRVERKKGIYWVWYLPATKNGQRIAKADYKRYREGR